VPSTGRSARYPGKADSEVRSTAATVMLATPIQRRAIGSATAGDRWLGARSTRIRVHSARAAPAPSSQMRVGVVKYAAAWSLAVAWIDHASDTAEIARTPPRSRWSRPIRVTRRASASNRRINPGQTR
jgi:hypothetical protein